MERIAKPIIDGSIAGSFFQDQKKSAVGVVQIKNIAKESNLWCYQRLFFGLALITVLLFGCDYLVNVHNFYGVL